jgi:hypothetical protein
MAEEIKETWKAFNISIRTVRSRLLETGLNARTPNVKHFLKETHRANRIKLAREHIHYNLDFWRKIILSDKKKRSFLPTALRNTSEEWMELGMISLIFRATTGKPENQLMYGAV